MVKEPEGTVAWTATGTANLTAGTQLELKLQHNVPTKFSEVLDTNINQPIKHIIPV